jgi:hypothetical protein
VTSPGRRDSPRGSPGARRPPCAGLALRVERGLPFQPWFPDARAIPRQKSSARAGGRSGVGLRSVTGSPETASECGRPWCPAGPQSSASVTRGVANYCRCGFGGGHRPSRHQLTRIRGPAVSIRHSPAWWSSCQMNHSPQPVSRKRKRPTRPSSLTWPTYCLPSVVDALVNLSHREAHQRTSAFGTPAGCFGGSREADSSAS